jgi:hypothetical protein
MNGPSLNSGQEEYVIIDTKRVAYPDYIGVL